MVLQDATEQLQEWGNAVRIRAQEQHTMVPAGRVATQISKALVGGYEKPLLALCRLPNRLVLGTAHPLVKDCLSVVPVVPE